MTIAPSVEIFTVVRDEEKFIEFFYNFYKERLSNVKFTLLDMGSVDRTIEIAQKLGISIESRFEEKMSEQTNIDFKNTCWLNSKAEFVIIQDLDELLDVSDNFLINNKFSAIQAEAWDMVGEGQPLDEITKAVRLPYYDKLMMLRVADFKDIKFSPGSHWCTYSCNISNPIFLRQSMYHYNRLSLDYVLKKYETRKSRLSKENIDNGWGVQYLLSENQIREEYAEALATAIHIFPVDASLSPDYDPLEQVVAFYRKHFGAFARTIIDVGSRDGEDAKYLQNALHGQKVITIEADPESAKAIVRKYPEFIVWSTGVSNFKGRSSFQRVISENKEHRGSSSLKSTRVESWYNFETIEIEITTMKDLLESNFMNGEILDVVKIDCEGYTYQILEGLGDFLANIKLLHLETEEEGSHPDHVNTQGITDFMLKNGFVLVETSSEWGYGVIDQVWVNYDLVVYQQSVLR